MPFSFGERLVNKEVAVPSFRRRASVIDADRVDEPPQDPDRSVDAADALALADEAEAEAAEADAIAAAARARARAIRLRRQAQSAGSDAPANGAAPAQPETSAAVELTEPSADLTDSADPSDGVADEHEVAEVPTEEPAGTRRGRRLRRILKVLTAVIAVACTAALITLSVLMVIDHRHRAAEQQRRA